MDLTPEQIRAMTWVEFFVYFDGYALARSRSEEVSDDEFAKALAEEQLAGRA